MADIWSYSAGEYGNTVRVYEREPGGILYIQTPHPERPGRYRCKSLGHRNQAKAKSRADRTAAELREGMSRIEEGKISWAELFALYEKHHVPRLSKGHAKATKRRLTLWSRFLGATSDPLTLSRHDWQAFIDARTSGRIDAHGRAKSGGRPVRPVTVIRDLECLRAACRWGATWQTASGRRLLPEDPTRGLRFPKDPNPRRPCASRARYEKLRAVAGQVGMCRWWGPKPRRGPSYLPEILDVVVGTGRRISAVLALRYRDLVLETSPAAPWGRIRWPADTDKEGREQMVPIRPEVRAALDRRLEALSGLSWLFPSSSDPEEPVPNDTADYWLAQAEDLAGLPPLDGGRWHPYRRMWATERKHLPLADLARAGGWRSQATLQECYLSADEETTLRVVMGGEMPASEVAEEA